MPWVLLLSCFKKQEMSSNESEPVFTISGRTVKTDRPEPVTVNIDLFVYKKNVEPQSAVDTLLAGNYVLIDDYYSSGLTVLRTLKTFLEKKQNNQSFSGQRDSRLAYRELSHRLMLSISNNKLSVRRAPEIGWLKILYPDLKEFLLPFPQVQGLNSSWQWYIKGIHIPVLKSKIHPYYGTYFPTRFEHLELFSKWLKYYKGEKKSAFDIGIGSGVLSFLLLKKGFEKVYGTDSNPNAIIGLHADLIKTELYSKLELLHGDLFANVNTETELIVFNPPWLPAAHSLSGLDIAVYYDNDLFPRFFSEAKKHLKPNGRLLILFSNLAQITNLSKTHPIEAELSEEKRFEKEFFAQMDVAPASKNTKRNQTWRSSEMVELWILKLNNSKLFFIFLAMYWI